MPNPNQINFASNEATDTHESLDQTPKEIKEERGEKTLGNYDRFKHLSREELMQIQPEDLPKEQLPAFIAAHKSWIAKYEKIIADAKEKEAAKDTETEASAPDLSGIDTIVADREPISTSGQEPIAGPVQEPAPITATPIPRPTSEKSPTPTSGASTEPTIRTIPVVEPISPEDAGEVSTLTPERVATTKEDTKKDPKAKGFFNTVTKKVLPVVLAATVALGGIFGMAAQTGETPRDDGGQQPGIELVQSGESHEAHHGIYDGYYETGEFMSANKGTPYDFANTAEVASVVGHDECDVTKEIDHNQVESLADHLANIPDEVKAKYGISSEFKGLSILETEKKLESLSDDDYDKLLVQVDQVWEDAFTESVTLNGDYHNAYMRLIDPSKPATHDNIELVECTTHENNTPATKFYWTVDGNANSAQIGSMIVKISHDSDGNIIAQCDQSVNQVGTNSHLYEGMTSVPGTPDTPTPPEPTPPEPTPPEPTPPEPTPPEEEIAPKDPDNMQRIDQNILDDIAEDVGTDEVRVTPNPGVSQDDLTERPSSDAYEGTEPEIVQNEPSQNAEPVQDQVSSDNNYSENRGGAHDNEYSPVQANDSAQAAADAAEIPIDKAPTGGQELDDALSDLGIN